MSLTLRAHKLPALWISVLLAVVAVATLAFTTTNAVGGCRHVQGRVFNAGEGEDHGRMIGTINGDYWFAPEGGYETYDPKEGDGSVTLARGPSRVDGRRGTVYFIEYSAVDFGEQIGTNGAVLAIVTGGTGQWENASGHVVFSGYYHSDYTEGVWNYQGEVCLP